MTDVDDRLTHLLTRSADAVVVRPDLDAVLAAADRAVVRLDDHPRRTRRRLAVAGLAAALVVVVAGLAVVLADRAGVDEPVGVTDAPAGDTVYPVVEVLPDGFSGRTEILDEAAHDGPLPTGSTTVLGRADGDRFLDLTVLQTVGGDLTFADLSDGATPATVAGRRASVSVEDGFTVVDLDGDPLLTAFGPGDVVGLLDGLGVGGLVGQRGADGGTTLTLGTLPPRWEVLAGPEPGQQPGLREVTVADGDATAGVTGVAVTTVSQSPAVALAHTGVVHRVTVGGQPALSGSADGVATVAWSAPNGITVVVMVVGGEEADALVVAEGVRLVDEATWRDIYREAEDTSSELDDATPNTDVAGRDDSTATTAGDAPDDILGLSAPPLPGRGTAGEEVAYDGHWTVVALGPMDCAGRGCADMELDALVGVVAPPGPVGVPPQPELQLVAVVEVPSVGQLADDAEAVGFTGAGGVAIAGTSVDLVEAWLVDGLPAFAVVDPDGIVVDVAVGPVTTQAIVQALTEATGEG